MGVTKAAIPSAGTPAARLPHMRRVPASKLMCSCRAIRRSPIRSKSQQYGAKLTLVDGLINDCGRIIAERKIAEGWFDLSTLKEPYRVEGKKTMGYEIAEQLDWHLPDVIIYPDRRRHGTDRHVEGI